MSKPLARYADDEDLERLLREREREGDPMLAFIKRKVEKNVKQVGKARKGLCRDYVHSSVHMYILGMGYIGLGGYKL